MTIILNSIKDFNLKSLQRIAVDGETVKLGEAALVRIKAANEAFKAFISAHPDQFVYGLTSDYGPRANVRMSTNERRDRQQLGVPFLGLSFGDQPLEESNVRAMIFTLLALYVRGGAAVSPVTAVALANSLKGPLPDIPDGGLTSPGEIMPLFYLLQAIPELTNHELQASSGNTAACSMGMAGLSAIQARRRMVLALKIFVLSIEAMAAPLEHYDPALKALWGDPYEARVLDNIGYWLDGVDNKGRRAFQAPVSYRILPRLMGQSERATSALIRTVEAGLQSMTCNPMFIPADLGDGEARAISTGGFHHAPVAQALDNLSANWVDLASLAHRQIIKLHRGKVSHLPDRLLPEGDQYWSGRTTSYLEFVPNDMLDEMRRWAEPSLLSPAEPGASFQDDVSAPGLIACRTEHRVAILFDRIMAVLAAVALHALDVTKRPPPPRLHTFAEAVRKQFPPIVEKRVLGDDLARLAASFGEAAMRGNDLVCETDINQTATESGDTS